MTANVNEQIKDPFVILIMDDGTKFGKTTTKEALNQARLKQLDLLQVSVQDNCPVCKLVNYGKLKYQEAKRHKQHITTNHIIKEIRISYNISEHDLATKNRQVLSFLEKGYRVKYTMNLSGREKWMLDTAKLKFDNILLNFNEFGTYHIPSISQTDRKIVISTLVVSNKLHVKLDLGVVGKQV